MTFLQCDTEIENAGDNKGSEQNHEIV